MPCRSTPTGPRWPSAALAAGATRRQRRLRRAGRPGDGRGRARRRVPVGPHALARAQRADAASWPTTTTWCATCAPSCGERVDAAVAAGVDPAQLVLDPGLGFAKNAEHNWALLAALDGVRRHSACRCWSARRASPSSAGCWPIPTARRAPTDGREDATVAITAPAPRQGVWGVRVHEVRPSVDAALAAAAIAGGAPVSGTDDRIALTGLRVRGRHGVFEHERRDGQDFVVDAVLEMDTAAGRGLGRPGRHRRLRRPGERLAAVVAGEPVNLIETLVAPAGRRVPARPAGRGGAGDRAQAAGPDPADLRRRRRDRRRGGTRGVSRRRAVRSGPTSATGPATAAAPSTRLRAVAVGRVAGLRDPALGAGRAGRLPQRGTARRRPGADAPRTGWPRAHAAEQAAGRTREVRWGPRTLDVDVIDVDDGVERRPAADAAAPARARAGLRPGAVAGRRPGRGARPGGRWPSWLAALPAARRRAGPPPTGTR